MSFIAAMDNSGGSAGGVLDLYGQTWTEDDKMEKIHAFRMRMAECMNENYLTVGKTIDTAILYKDSVERGAVPILAEKGIASYLKIDEGCEGNGTLKLFDINAMCEYAVKNGCTGTKMRSIVYDHYLVDCILTQQFAIAKIITLHGLMPIVEPEVPIQHPNKFDIERRLNERIIYWLDNIDYKVTLKLTLPSDTGLYNWAVNHRNVHRIVALSGGYDLEDSCKLLSQNVMGASFSRALAEGLRYEMSDAEFKETIQENIKRINTACLQH